VNIDAIIYSIIALIGAFGAIGIYLIVKSLRYEASRNPRPPVQRNPIRRLQDYVGDADDSKRLLNAPLRVTLEFFLALCGFPGIGWMASGQLAVGLVLVAAVPSIFWAVAPVLMASNGALFRDPFATVRYLPIIAIVSAGGLATSEIMRARKARRAA
jgi:hypothetical protein